MSGTGSALESGGVPGEVVSETKPMAQTMPDNPGTIAQTTSSITLPNLLTRDFIYKDTPTISTSMPPGTVFAAYPNHPSQSNYVNAHVSQLFNTWTGHFILRFRLLATAWYGGSIRVAILPPNFTREQINNMSLETLTAYANLDYDPKNTEFQYIACTDQRDTAYHYNRPFNDTDYRSFGGWVVLFVAGRLVTQAPEFTTIQCYVEIAGNYIYDQPRPLTGALTVDHPLALSTQVPLPLQARGESYIAGTMGFLMVFASTVATVFNGIVDHAAIGKDILTGAVPGVVVSNPTVLLAARSRNKCPYALMHGDATSPGAVVSGIPESSTSPYISSTDARAQLANINVNGSADNNYVAYRQVRRTLQESTAYPELKFAGTVASNYEIHLSHHTHHTWLGQMVEGPLQPASNPPPSPNFGSFSAQAPNESICCFYDPLPGFYATQTALMSKDLTDYPVDLSNTDQSFIYALRNGSGVPVALFRLNPNGVWTTNAAAASVLYPLGKGTTLSFQQRLSLNQPLPPLSSSMRALRHTLMQAARPTTVKQDYYKVRELMEASMECF